MAESHELPTDWWTVQDVATYLAISESTVRAYAARQQMPPPDRRMGNLNLWRPSTITDWAPTRRKGTSS